MILEKYFAPVRAKNITKKSEIAIDISKLFYDGKFSASVWFAGANVAKMFFLLQLYAKKIW